MILTYRPIRQFGRGDGTIGDRLGLARHHGVPHCGDALVWREQLRAVHPVVEPDAQVHLAIGEDRSRHHGHVGQAGVAKQYGVKTFRNIKRYRNGWLTPVNTAPVVTPIGGIG